MPLGFPPEALESGLRYVPSDSDIFVVSYPKSGTTWLQYIVYLLVRQRGLAANESLTDVFPHLEESGGEVVSALPQPRLIKTHLCFEMTPYIAQARYLVIARNPFDCAVSFFHHTRGFPRHYNFAAGTFADFFDCFLRGEVDFGDYFDHFASWYAQSGNDNVLFLTYEELKRDCRGMVCRIADFLGAPARDSIASEADLDGLLAETSLAAMRRHQQRWTSARPPWAEDFVRKGVVGDWRTLFNPGQARALLAKFDARMSDAGIRNPWPAEFVEARAFVQSDASGSE
jgi:hypothetical protein